MPTLDASRFQFISEALNGDGGFAPVVSNYGNTIQQQNLVSPRLDTKTYLVQYPRESKDKFARRNQVCWYRNFLNPACVRFVGYLAKKPPIRQLNNPLLDTLAQDCDWRGNSLDVFWSSFAIDAKARGSMLLLVDMPRVLPGTLADQVEQRAIPYLAAIPPERVVQYDLNDQGRLARVAISELRDTQEVWRVFDEQAWWIQRPGNLDDTALRLEGDVHGLGICPVLAFTENGDFPHVGSYAQIADLSRRYFNAASERDEILRSQTFSLLTYQVPSDQVDFEAGTVAEAIGTHNMLVHRGDAPEFIAPPDGPATIYSEVLAQLEEAIRRVSLTVEQPTQAESGVALSIRFQELNSALTHFARRMEDLERRMWDVVCRWLDLPDNTEVAWAKSYELADLALEMTVLNQMQASGFPPEVIQAEMKNIIGLQFATVDSQEMDDLMMAVDNMATEVEPVEANTP